MSEEELSVEVVCNESPYALDDEALYGLLMRCGSGCIGLAIASRVKDAVGQIFSFPILQSTANLPAGKSGDTNTKHTADEEHLCRVRICSVWYARRDSNPQPSEPESDALSIEPLAHFIDSLCIIPTFFIFVKGCTEKYFLVFQPCSAKTVVFSEYMWYNSEKC